MLKSSAWIRSENSAGNLELLKTIREFSLFIKHMIKDPRSTGALIPSSAGLGHAMSSCLPPGVGQVVELGGGTGRITNEILKIGVPASDLIVFEMNPEFTALLKTRFPGLRVENRMAQAMPELGITEVGAVVSGLPLLNMSVEIQNDIVASVLTALRPGGCFIQFTYGFKPPLAPEVIQKHGLTWQKRKSVWINLPPAHVYVFQRQS